MRWLLTLCLACHSTASGSPDAGTSASADEIIAACEIDQACAIDASGASGINDCLRFWTQGRPLLQPQVVHCMAAAAGNCAMARACVGQTARSTPSCSAATSCTGDTLSQCAFGIQILTDCTVNGAHCLTSGSAAACAIANTCTADACAGTQAVRCKGSFAQAGDCAAIGDTCALVGTAPDQTSECRGTGAACTSPRIDGNAIVYCDFGFEHRVDCSTAVPGGALQVGTSSTGGTIDYCGLATECPPSGVFATCVNNQLTMCAFGAVRTVDCSALGYIGCDGSGGGCKPAALL